MTLFPRRHPAPRPGKRPLVPCIATNGSNTRCAFLSVPLVLLLAFILTIWFDVFDPFPVLESPSTANVPFIQAHTAAELQAVETATTATWPAGATPYDPLAPISTSPEDSHASPFSFDIAAALTGRNASLYADWMAAAPDDWSLARLAIPGTHDTMTHRVDLLGYRCQNAALGEQLAAGVRYLDVRARVQVQPTPPSSPNTADPLGIYHASVYTGYEFADVAQTVFAFLAAHPSEIVIMRLKEEALPLNGSVSDPPGPAKDAGQFAVDAAVSPPFLAAFDNYRLHDPRTAPGLAKHLYRFNATDDPQFQTPPPAHIPSVGELRGKILVLQEFPYFPVSYLAAPPGAIPWFGVPWELSSRLLEIEDYWQTPDLAALDDKWDAVRDNLQSAAKNATASDDATKAGMPLFLSHLSASVGLSPIDAAAGPLNHSVVGINDRAGRWLERGDDVAEGWESGGPHSGPYTPVGVVMADFPGRRLIDAILRRNSFFEFEDY
ncbi:uncharacterized protein SPSK_10319 [Sporothrix schenckii 1099-18]|uniref:Phosphatidylinositol-specific phospholipase C X domain-containing protein n=2 Tax=Sporothrix schenckii TaxID=29908 RepID=U7Q3X9_SPOS1|nr:uncharacterized protein SPSK_10319 [Sporothrix schenckii 1099-18]ERT02553.1 hypothetical protein HMPREF1624_00853 [Sporothrix schenckii ATCC 58251]KJR80157.1 hypothetical protein SPSK_10319 [Sporothrix schenckii 1099-18]